MWNTSVTVLLKMSIRRNYKMLWITPIKWLLTITLHFKGDIITTSLLPKSSLLQGTMVLVTRSFQTALKCHSQHCHLIYCLFVGGLIVNKFAKLFGMSIHQWAGALAAEIGPGVWVTIVPPEHMTSWIHVAHGVLCHLCGHVQAQSTTRRRCC